MRLAWATALLLAGTLALSSGCKQGEGDRCQLDSDCGDDLVCCVDPAALNQGGICRPKGKCDISPSDSGTDGIGDSGPLDGLLDQTVPPDEGAAPDKSPPDQAPTPDQKPAPDVTPNPDVTPDPDQQISADTLPVDLAGQD